MKIFCIYCDESDYYAITEGKWYEHSEYEHNKLCLKISELGSPSSNSNITSSEYFKSNLDSKFIIIDDLGDLTRVPKNYFKTQLEVRVEKLNKLGI